MLATVVSLCQEIVVIEVSDKLLFCAATCSMYHMHSLFHIHRACMPVPDTGVLCLCRNTEKRVKEYMYSVQKLLVSHWGNSRPTH